MSKAWTTQDSGVRLGKPVDKSLRYRPIPLPPPGEPQLIPVDVRPLVLPETVE